MLTLYETSSQRILYDPLVPPVESTPIFSCPSDVLIMIGRLLSNKDAIHFTSVCTQLFNLRFIGSGGGIILGQCWKRVPGLTETLSSTIILPNGRGDITKRRMISHAAPAITTLHLNFCSPLDAEKANSVEVILQQLVKLNLLQINCNSLSASTIHIFLTMVINARVQGAQNLFLT